MSVFSRTAFFQKKKAPAAKLKEHLGFHKEPIRSQGTGKVTRNRFCGWGEGVGTNLGGEFLLWKFGFPEMDFPTEGAVQNLAPRF